MTGRNPARGGDPFEACRALAAEKCAERVDRDGLPGLSSMTGLAWRRSFLLLGPPNNQDRRGADSVASRSAFFRRAERERGRESACGRIRCSLAVSRLAAREAVIVGPEKRRCALRPAGGRGRSY